MLETSVEAIVMPLFPEAQVTAGTRVEARRHDPSGEPDAADRLLERVIAAGELDRDVDRPRPFAALDLRPDVGGSRIERPVRPEPLRKLAALLDGVDGDDEGRAGDARELNAHQPKDTEAEDGHAVADPKLRVVNGLERDRRRLKQCRALERGGLPEGATRAPRL